MKRALEEANRKARLRDIENSKIISDEQMNAVNEAQAQAQARGMMIVPERKVKNRARFVQMMQDNIAYIMETEYLKNEEMKFLFRIIPYIAVDSNCIVNDIHQTKNSIPMTQVDIANTIGSSKQTVNRIINQLIDKGIIAKTESGKEDLKARSYALFLNPNIIYSGDRDNVNLTLQAMFKKVPKALRNLPQQIC